MTETIHIRYQKHDNWKTAYLYPIFEFKPFANYYFMCSTNALAVEDWLHCEGAEVTIQNIVESTVWSMERDYIVGELIDD